MPIIFSAQAVEPISKKDEGLRLVVRTVLFGTLQSYSQNGSNLTMTSKTIYEVMMLRSIGTQIFMRGFYPTGTNFSLSTDYLTFHGIMTNHLIFGRFVTRVSFLAVVTYDVCLLVV
ncbi:MAG: hypothetical protein NT038_07270 [Euryarchaeota archaeon]|nr:hypothetical protein [Euryarchaeota archaeon]